MRLQQTRNGSTQTEHSSGSPSKSDHECVRESSKMMIDQTCMQDSSIGGAASHNIDCSEPQGNVFNHVHRCVTCVLPREVPETHADTATSGGQNGHRRWESRTDEEEHVRNEGGSQQLGTRLARARQELGISTGTQLEESVPPQRGPSVWFNTR